MLKACLNTRYILLLVLREEWFLHQLFCTFDPPPLITVTYTQAHTHLSFQPQQGTDMWNGKTQQQQSGPLAPAFWLSRPFALLVIHSWAILGGSYVNAWVCFWLGGTKSTLYKCTLKQLPLLPTAAPTQTSDWAADWLSDSGKRGGYGSFTATCHASV